MGWVKRSGRQPPHPGGLNNGLPCSTKVARTPDTSHVCCSVDGGLDRDKPSGREDRGGFGACNHNRRAKTVASRNPVSLNFTGRS